MEFTRTDIDHLERRHRSYLINSLSGIKSANLIGTVNSDGQTNLSIVSSVIHLGAHPPLMGYIQRPDSVERHTYENILSQKHFTINAVEASFTNQAHQTSARYSRDESEFNEVGLTEQWLTNFPAPFVKESSLKIGLKLAKVIPIELNNTLLVIGSVEYIQIPDEVYESDGHLRIEHTDIVGVVGLDSYVKTSALTRLSYAKTDQPLKEF